VYAQVTSTGTQKASIGAIKIRGGFRFRNVQFGSIATFLTAGCKCPQCGKLMKSFEYCFYDLQTDFCEELHGYWLVADEDKRVLELMRKEKKNLARKVLAEDRFAAHLRYLRSGSFMDRVRDLTRVAMDPKPKPTL
jgi:Zn-finger nucleic acid-binding protein